MDWAARFLCARRQQQQEARSRKRRKLEVLNTPHPDQHLDQRPHFSENILSSEGTSLLGNVRTESDIHVCNDRRDVEDAKGVRIFTIRRGDSRFMQVLK